MCSVFPAHLSEGGLVTSVMSVESEAALLGRRRKGEPPVKRNFRLILLSHGCAAMFLSEKQIHFSYFLKCHSSPCWEFLQVTDAASARSDPTAQLFQNTVAPSRGHLWNSPPTPPGSGAITSYSVLCFHLFTSETPSSALTRNWSSIFSTWSGEAKRFITEYKIIIVALLMFSLGCTFLTRTFGPKRFSEISNVKTSRSWEGVVTAVTCRGQPNITHVSKLWRLSSEVRDLLEPRVSGCSG